MSTPLRAVAAVVAIAVVVVLGERAVEDRPQARRDERVTAVMATNVDVYPTRPATLPPGIRAIDEPKGFVATRDVLPGLLRLPSGHIAADAYFTGETKPLAERAAPGSYRVSVTLARSVEDKIEGENVALATLELSSRPTVSWRQAGTIGVDGGTAAFSSAEGAAALGRLLAKDDKRWIEQGEAITRSMDAHDGLVTLADIDDDTNLLQFTTGLGDGGYEIHAGLDAEQRPTRLVVDCGLLHLDWPRSG